jgi:hypothetical protein
MARAVRCNWRNGYPLHLLVRLVALLGSHVGSVERIGFTLERLPIVLATIHLRVANRFISPDWLAL